MLSIREAKTADLEALIQLIKAHAIYEGTSASFSQHDKDKLAALLFTQKHLHCLIAEQEGQLMGYTTFTVQYASFTANKYLYMDCLYIKAEARGKGTGKVLINRIAAYMKKEGITEAQWQTPIANATAIRFYQQLGATDLV